MPTLYVKVKHPELTGKLLTVKAEIQPQYNYLIRGGYITEGPLLMETPSDMEEPPSPIEFTADTFSKVIAEHGFDEVETLFQIEEALEGMASQDTLL